MNMRQKRDSGVLLLMVDRPGARNAINAQLVTDLVAALDDVGKDETIHAVVLAATGDVFLSGGDLNELSALPANSVGAEQVLRMGVSLSAFERCPVPVIAAVHADVFGGGCELLLMCDVVVMQRGASLRFVHARMGLVPAWGGTTRLRERVGHARTADILLTTRPVGANEACSIGLAARVSDDALAAAMTMARQLGAIGRPALANIKRALLETREGGLAREQKSFRAAWGSPQNRAAFRRLAAAKGGGNTRGR